jgi:hypothetical protein
MSIGSGLVLDSFGERSAQQDIIMFERDYCPIYTMSEAADATYFPTEGVIAVGEVDSELDSAALLDALGKIKSAKILQRFSAKTPNSSARDAASYRHYGAATTFEAVADDEFNQLKKGVDQIFGFVICGSFKHGGKNVLNDMVEFAKAEGYEFLPNFVVSLTDGFVQNCDFDKMKLRYSSLDGNVLAFVPDLKFSFNMLVRQLRLHVRVGRTVPLSALDRYISAEVSYMPVQILARYR